MNRYHRLCLAAVLLLFAAACEKSAEPQPRASVARDNMMPAADPTFEPIYVANQKDVKLAPARTVSYEPLDTFREQNAAAAEALRAKQQAKASASAAEEVTEQGESAGESDGGYLNAEQIEKMKAQGQKEGPPTSNQADDENADDEDDTDDDLDSDDSDEDDEDLDDDDDDDDGDDSDDDSDSDDDDSDDGQ